MYQTEKLPELRDLIAEVAPRSVGNERKKPDVEKIMWWMLFALFIGSPGLFLVLPYALGLSNEVAGCCLLLFIASIPTIMFIAMWKCGEFTEEALERQRLVYKAAEEAEEAEESLMCPLKKAGQERKQEEEDMDVALMCCIVTGGH